MVELDAVTLRYPDGTLALDDVSAVIPCGAFVLTCGANGSGKSSLLHLIAGLIRPSHGSVTVDGVDAARGLSASALRVGMVFQNADTQIIGETVAEDVAVGPENLGLDPTEVRCRVAESLDVMGLTRLAERSCHLLSGGEKRRVALAGVLAMRPDVLALDEPLTTLDFSGARDLLSRLADLHADRRTIVLATHEVEPVFPLATSVLLLDRGRLVGHDTPSAIAPLLERHAVRPPGAPWTRPIR